MIFKSRGDANRIFDYSVHRNIPKASAMSQSFSDRYGYKPPEPEITIREDAPDDLRYAVAQIAVNAGLSPSSIRDVVCDVLFVAPDRNNWSDYPNIWDEVRWLLERCEWFKVYDIAERLHRGLHYHQADQFRDELNRLFREKGIGWELKDHEGIVFRGSAPFAAATTNAVEALTATGRLNAASEIREALKDISRRPTPDRTGAIQHSIAALESVARDIANEPGLTLGRLLPRLGLPRPLDEAVEKLWGFASERARHIREGQQLGDDEAELVVSVACAVSIFLIHRK